MKIKPIREYDKDTVEYVANRLSEILRVDEKGNFILDPNIFEYYDMLALLFGSIKLVDEIQEVDARRIIGDSIRNAKKEEKLNEREIKANVYRLANQYLNKKEEKYVIATSISISRIFELSNFRLEGKSIIFNRNHPQRYQDEINRIIRDAQNSVYGELPQDYYGVRIFVNAKSQSSAMINALNTIDIMRGFWNLFYNSRQPRVLSWGHGTKDPINKIVLGPIHTLHKSSGILASENTWWYEPNYNGPRNVLILNNNEFSSVINWYKFWWKKLRNHSYRYVLEKALIEYSRALDIKNIDIAFIRLWSVLEMLTNPEHVKNYDLMIKRSTFIWDNRNYQEKILNQLRKYRNENIHSNKESKDILIYVYQLKNTVENILLFHMKNKFRFKSLKDACMFLELPSTESELNKQIIELSKGIAFRKRAKVFHKL